MNAPLQHSSLVNPEAPRRHRFSFEELLGIQALGILGDGRVELVDGEIVHMPADGVLHRSWTLELAAWFAQHLNFTKYALLTNTTLNTGHEWFPSPDFYLHDRSKPHADVRAHDVLLVIEQADTSLERDLIEKAADYAEVGVRDYWVIDLNSRKLHVHREPSVDGYRSKEVFESAKPVSALLIPGLTLRIADLPNVG